MILARLDVNGKIMLAECESEKKARTKMDEWLTEVKKNFPNGHFTPQYYKVAYKF